MSLSKALEPIVTAAPVIPVLIVEDVTTAVPLARALVAGGLKAVEITLRTGAALDAIERIAGEVENAVVGAGTVLSKRQLISSARAGAQFIVSPGYNADLLKAADDSPVPVMLGASTASEVMTLMDSGYTIQKFFPAEAAGGVAYLKALASPLPAIRFCPTGGVDARNAGAYLALDNVLCVGGSWVAPEDAVASGDWGRIEALALEASRLVAT
jgi:2-dehydro-3-deoxyphosphogluconate aldolase/(4S)-4-hydroxy-2-oxoglutarate aldolase